MGVLGFSVDFKKTFLGISHPVSVSIAIFGFYYCFRILVKGYVTVTKSSKIILVLLIAPVILSLSMIPVYIIESGDTSYYSSIEPWARVGHILILAAFFLFGWDVVSRDPNKMMRYIVSSYLIVLSVVVFVGILQWLNFYCGVPIMYFYSRSHMHGVGVNILSVYGQRLTSFLGEPAFFVTYLLDFLMLSLVFFSNKILKFILFSLSLWLLCFTFSISGLAVVAFLCLQYIILNFKKKIITIIVLAIPMILVLTWVVGFEDFPYGARVNFMKNRFLGEPRIMDSMASIDGALKSNILNSLFGHGPGSYATLGEYRVDDHYRRLPQTSNNLYADWLYENGFVGLFMLLIFFVYQVKLSVKRSWKYSIDFWLPFLTTSLAVGSLFRTDFSAPRFWLMLLIVTVLNQYGVNVLKKSYGDKV